MPEYEYSDAPWRFRAAPERPGAALDGWILPDGTAFDDADPCVAYVEGVGSLDLALILAAPELLTAALRMTCQFCLTKLDGPPSTVFVDPACPMCSPLRAAIDKARGETPR